MESLCASQNVRFVTVKHISIEFQRYDMFKEESRKTVTGNFQDAANEMRMEMGEAKSWAKKRTENNIWGKQTSSKGAAAEKDHTG